MSVTWKDGAWIVDGNPPNGLQLTNGIWKSADGVDSPECFGILWDGMGVGGTEDCKSGCDFAPACMELTARQALPASQIRLGAGHNLESLAADLGIPEGTVMALMVYAQGGPSPLVTRPSKKAPPPAESKAPEVSREAFVPKQEKRVKPPKEKKVSPKKKPLSEKVRASAKVPPKAPSAKRAKGGASVKGTRAVKTAKALAVTPATGKWGAHTFQERRAREMKRSPLIRKLQPGMILETQYKRKSYQVEVLPEGYRSKGKMYPTLYSVTVAFTGTEARPCQVLKGKRKKGSRQLSNYSAVRFWKLQKLFPKVAPKVSVKAKPDKVSQAPEASPAIPTPTTSAPPPMP